MRPTFENIYMDFAAGIARRSTCARAQVGAVLTSSDFRRVFSVGYNGNASGLPNGCESHEPGQCGCLHAEANAIINCTVSRAEDKILFCTHLPCPMCAKMLINLGGVRTVVYRNDYRVTRGKEFLQKAGILVLPEGEEK
jgi:dCMP deaminase